MPAIYDRIERCWRAEDDQDQIIGYYTTEAAALATLQLPEDDSDFRGLLELIDLLVELDDMRHAEPAPRPVDSVEQTLDLLLEALEAEA